MCKLFSRSAIKPRIIFWDVAFFTLHTPSFPLLPAKICRKRSKISLITRRKVRLFLLGDENKFWFEETRLPFAVNLHSCNSVVYVSDSSVHIVAERPHCSIKADLLFTNSLRNSIWLELFAFPLLLWNEGQRRLRLIFKAECINMYISNDFLEVITITHSAGNFSLLRLNCKCARVIAKLDAPSFFLYWRTLTLYICTVFIGETNMY